MTIYVENGRFRVEVQHKGRRLRGRFSSRAEAEKAEADWKKGIDENFVSHTLASKHTIPLTLSEVLKLGERHVWRGKKYEAECVSKVWKIADMIGHDFPPMTFSIRQLDKIVAELLDDEKSPKTINRYLSAFHCLYKWGAARGYFPQELLDPKLEAWDWQDEGEGRIRWITPEEEEGIYAALPGSTVAVLIKVAIATGMRRGELLGLSKGDIDGAWVRLWGDRTKTKASRSVPITRETREDLLWLLGQGMPTLGLVRWHWKIARKALGLEDDPYFVFHACRHTCATRLVHKGVHLATVKEWMGHKRFETTLRYAHVSNDLLQDALAKLTSVPQVGHFRTPTSPTSELDAECGLDLPMIT